MWLGIESLIFSASVLFIWVDTSFQLYLMNRQLKAVKGQRDIPEGLEDVIPLEVYEKTRNYANDRTLLHVGRTLYYCTINTIFVIFSWNAFLWNKSKNILLKYTRIRSEIVSSMIFMFLNNGSNILIDLPILIFDTFVVEGQHGFNMQSTSMFFGDRITYFLVSQTAFLPISAVTVFIIKYTGERFYMCLWIFTCGLCLVINSTTPIFEFSLQLITTKLQEGPLKRGFESLATSVEFPPENIYVFKASDRSRHTNAYFAGVGDSRRIVLYDTLLNRESSESEPSEITNGNPICSDEEILAIVCHEFGHWKRNHLLIRLLFIQINSLISLMIYSHLKTMKPLLRAFGFYQDDPALIRLFTVLELIMAPINVLSGITLVFLTRIMEFDADDYAKSMGYAEPLKRALVKLHIQNLTCPTYDWLYYLMDEAHPSLLERLRRLNNVATPELLY